MATVARPAAQPRGDAAFLEEALGARRPIARAEELDRDPLIEPDVTCRDDHAHPARTEHALDASYAQKLGVDVDNLLVSQPDNGEQALEIVEVLIRSNGVDVVVVVYKAAGDVAPAIYGNQVQLSLFSESSANLGVKAGKMKVLASAAATTSDSRSLNSAMGTWRILLDLSARNIADRRRGGKSVAFA